MADDLSKRGVADRRLINVWQRHERYRWAKKFGVSQVALVLAHDVVLLKSQAPTVAVFRELIERTKRDVRNLNMEARPKKRPPARKRSKR